MANRIRTGDPVDSIKDEVPSSVQVPRVGQTPGEDRRIYRPKRGGNNYKDEDHSPKTLNDKNHQASSQTLKLLF